MGYLTEYNGIKYEQPEVLLLQETGIGTSEIAARTCYDSFKNSNSREISDFPYLSEHYYDREDDTIWTDYLNTVNNLDESGLLHDLAWTQHHYSILEHCVLTYHIKGTSRGVLAEHSRHRLQSISVRSSRYTMSDILYAFIVSYLNKSDEFFINTIIDLDMFVTSERDYNVIEAQAMGIKLLHQANKIGFDEFVKLALTKENIEKLSEDIPSEELYKKLQEGRKKRNAGDSFKHIVTDNWKVDLVVTFNLRSLSNYLKLRGSGAAWFQINWLAEEMIKATPIKYLKLIDKKYKDS